MRRNRLAMRREHYDNDRDRKTQDTGKIVGAKHPFEGSCPLCPLCSYVLETRADFRAVDCVAAILCSVVNQVASEGTDRQSANSATRSVHGLVYPQSAGIMVQDHAAFNV